MKEIKCGIVRDLLPAYLDEMTGDTTTDMIKEHLTECSYCRDGYNQLRQERKQAVDRETEKGRQFQKKLISYRTYIIGFFIGLLIPVAAVLLMYLLLVLCGSWL